MKLGTISELYVCAFGRGALGRKVMVMTMVVPALPEHNGHKDELKEYFSLVCMAALTSPAAPGPGFKQ